MCKRKEDSSSWRSNPATFHQQQASTLSVVPMAPWGFRSSMVKLRWQVDNLNSQVMRSLVFCEDPWDYSYGFRFRKAQGGPQHWLDLSHYEHHKHNIISSWKDELLCEDDKIFQARRYAGVVPSLSWFKFQIQKRTRQVHQHRSDLGRFLSTIKISPGRSGRSS